jgi:hypothetical protein
VRAAGGIVSLQTNGAITQSGSGNIVAGILNGGASLAALNGANHVDQLGTFSTTSDFTLVNAKALTQGGGTVSTLTGNILIETGGNPFVLAGALVTVSSTGTVTLGIAGNSVGPVTETGSITAGTLSGNTIGGAQLAGNNQLFTIGTLTNSGTGDVAITNAQALTLAGSIDVGTGNNLTLRTTGANSALVLNGAASAGGTVNLVSTASITEANTGSIAAATLTGTSASDATLVGTNRIGSLGQFSTAGSLTISNAQTLAVTDAITVGGTVTINAAGQITETANGIIKAPQLAGSSVNGAALVGDNAIDALGNFTNTGGGTVAVTDGKSLSLTGVVDAGAGNLTLTTTGGGSALHLGGTILAGGTVTLTSADLIDQAGNGSITAGTLTGSTAGSALLLGVNQISTLRTFTSNGDFALLNLAMLTQSAGTTLDATSGVIVVNNGGRAFTQAGTLQTTNDTVNAVKLLNTGALSIGTITVGTGAGTVTLGIPGLAVGPVSETGSITAATLNGTTQNGATLNRANLLSQIGAFTNTGTGDVAITNAASLTVAAGIDAGAGNTLTLTTTGAQHALILGSGTLSAGGTVNLVSANRIDQSAGGIITAGTLTGSAASGDVNLIGANRVSGLGGFSVASGNFALSNTVVLTQAFGTAVDAGAGTIAIDNGSQAFTQAGTLRTTNDTATAVTIQNTGPLAIGTITTGTTGGTVTLGIAGKPVNAVAETGTITTGTLTLATTGGASLTQANQVGQLGPVANSDASTVSFTNAAPLILAGAIDVGAGNNLTLTTTGATNGVGHAIGLGANSVSAANGVVTLNSAGQITQDPAGVITAGLLTGTSSGGASLIGANQINALGSFTNNGGGGFALTNTGSLALAPNAFVAAGADNLTLISLNSGALLLQGTLSAGGTISASAGGIALIGDLTTTTAAVTFDTAGGTFSDGGFKLTTSNSAFSLTTGTISLAAPTAIDSGSGTVTITASSGSALTAGDGVAGGLHLGSADLGRIAGAGLVLRTTGVGDDIALADIGGAQQFGALTVQSAHNVTLGNGTPFGGFAFTRNLTVDGRQIALTSDVNAAGSNVTLNATGGIVQTGGVLSAATLSGTAGGVVSLTGANQVATLGSFVDSGAGGIAFINAGALLVTGGAGALVDAGSGPLTIVTTAGVLSLQGTLAAGGGSAAAPIRLAGAGGIALTGNTTASLHDPVGPGATTILVANGQGYTDNGFTFRTTNSALQLTASALMLTAGTTLDSGANSTTISAESGQGLVLTDGSSVAGDLNISGNELHRIAANGVTLETGAGSDILVDGFTSATSFGPLTFSAGRNVTFGPNGASFTADVTVNGFDLVFAGNFTAPKSATLTVHAGDTITQSLTSAIDAGTLTGSSVGDASFLGANRVNLGAFTLLGQGRTLTFNDADPIDLTAPLDFETGNLTLSSNQSITIEADVTVGGRFGLEAKGGPLNQTAGIITAEAFTGSSSGGANLEQHNHITQLDGFSNGGSGSVLISNGLPLILAGSFSSAGGILGISAPALTISDSSFSAPSAVVLSASGPLTQTGALTFSSNLAVLDSTGAAIDNLASFNTGNIAAGFNALIAGPANGTISVQNVTASGTLLFSSGTGSLTGAVITAQQLAVFGANGAATLGSVTIGGESGPGAAQIAFKSGDKENAYQINNCAIGSTSCIAVPRFVPVGTPPVRNFVLIEPTRPPDDSNLQAFSVGEEDLIQ